MICFAHPGYCRSALSPKRAWISSRLAWFSIRGVGLTKHGRVETFAKTFGRFSAFLFNFSSYLASKSSISTSAWYRFAVFVQYAADHWMHPRDRNFPGGGVHKDGGINSHHISCSSVMLCPTSIFQVVVRSTPFWYVIVHGTQAVVNLARREYKIRIHLQWAISFLKHLLVKP